MRSRIFLVPILILVALAGTLPATASAQPSEAEVLERLCSNGYPDFVIERMDTAWRSSRYNTNARYLGASLGADSADATHTTPVAVSLLNKPFRELVFAEEWESPVNGCTFIQINYLWEWQHRPLFSLTDYISISLRNGRAESITASYQARSGSILSKPVSLVIERKSFTDILVPLRRMRSFQDDGVHQADSYLGRISFTYHPEAGEVNPWVHLMTRYTHQRLPALFNPTWTSDGTGFRQWWAPSFFKSTPQQHWKLLPTT